MSKVLEDLLGHLALEKIEEGLFRGQSQNLGFGRVFGGQVIGQALSAAKETVEDRFVHSFHSYFLRPGDDQKPIVYDVENIRDGRSFSTRRVRALQYGKPVFYMTASFQTEEVGYEHSPEMPNVVGPEGLKSEHEFFQENIDKIPGTLRSIIAGEKPIEIRHVQVNDPFAPEKMPGRRQVWIKSNGSLPDDERIHRYLLAYASDFNFLPTALFPHGRSHILRDMQVATLDHSMWFHRPFRMDEWILFDMDSTSASGGRGLVKGQFFNQQGELVASAMQEGVIRDYKAFPKS
ncbi:acyl-CoA thioesterase II [Psychrosphaera haliotis]|uniref:Acyl-CoA thioesterase 2 n=1 Tax=Psychrosphaera haliotis TaxID=555083 RepID=A0A6N8FBW3_9GAMM|nr:acyl-CoA thioesterase II [Psychrosphaera haliotis]MUH73594.1 acyl-CoA thioesterase II [Psychrosphaera haliotis]